MKLEPVSFSFFDLHLSEVHCPSQPEGIQSCDNKGFVVRCL